MNNWKKIKEWILHSIVVCLLILLGFILGISTQSAEASTSPDITNVQNVQGVNYKYEVAYINGSKYIIFSNMSGSDIEVIK